eukprot:5668735-Alexandrium_andersonii.AAC.1
MLRATSQHSSTTASGPRASHACRPMRRGGSPAPGGGGGVTSVMMRRRSAWLFAVAMISSTRSFASRR